MRIFKPYMLIDSRLEDQVTIFNLVFPGKTLVVSKKWFHKLVEHDLLDDCCFHMRVVNKKFNPLIPTVL